ncbi:P27 family phage terminase small subunit, partial [Methylobacterium sp. Leaf100]|uniref:P27 family phage terminase small subunit n=1 Tax=Methylobacterium sp. Leaf100 TaxID=1736252 RepID=UPI001910DEBF
MRGRKPDLHAIEGGLSSVPRAPAWLPAEGKDEWKRVLPSLIRRRILTDTDMGVVESYCLAAGTVRRSQMTIAREGDWSAPIEVVRSLVWLLSLEDGQDGKAPEARGD